MCLFQRLDLLLELESDHVGLVLPLLELLDCMPSFDTLHEGLMQNARDSLGPLGANAPRGLKNIVLIALHELVEK